MADAVTVYWPGVALAVAVTPAWPPAMIAVAAESVAEAPPVPARGEADDAAVDRLDRVVGRHRDGQRVGERRADQGRLRGAAGDGREREPLALEGADVDVAGPRQAPLVGGRGARGRAAADGRAAGQQGHGRRSARRSRPAGPGAGCRRSGCCCR